MDSNQTTVCERSHVSLRTLYSVVDFRKSSSCASARTELMIGLTLHDQAGRMNWRHVDYRARVIRRFPLAWLPPAKRAKDFNETVGGQCHHVELGKSH